MIDEKIFENIKKLLSKSENPLFFFDDDCDGTCSFLLLRRFKGFGYHVPVKGGPEVTMAYYHKISEYNPDLIFILDKPKMSQEFVDKINVPIVWIDHHPIQDVKGIKIYCNPLLYDANDNRSTTFWSYKVVKQDMWIAMVGCIADYHIPDFASEFSSDHPDLFPSKIKDPGQALYETKIGQLVKIFNFNLKGKPAEVRKSLNCLVKIKDPYEILDKSSSEGKYVFDRFEKGNLIYTELFNKAMKGNEDKDFLVFTYPDNGFAVSSELSTELQYRNKGKYVIVGRVKEDSVSLSIRCNNRPVRDILLKALEGLNGYGGGHLHACGAGIPKDNFVTFIKRFKDLADKDIKGLQK